jgi:hypothetical protein
LKGKREKQTQRKKMHLETKKKEWRDIKARKKWWRERDRERETQRERERERETERERESGKVGKGDLATERWKVRVGDEVSDR